MKYFPPVASKYFVKNIIMLFNLIEQLVKPLVLMATESSAATAFIRDKNFYILGESVRSDLPTG